MGVQYVNGEQNVFITSTVSGIGAEEEYNTKMPYSKFTIQVTPTGGDVCIQVSLDGTNFIDWDAGAVSISTIDSCDAVCCIKVKNGTSTSTVVAIWGAR